MYMITTPEAEEDGDIGQRLRSGRETQQRRKSKVNSYNAAGGREARQSGKKRALLLKYGGG